MSQQQTDRSAPGRGPHFQLDTGTGQDQSVDGNSVNALFEEGLALHRERQVVEASERYERVIAIDPQHADALHLLGFAHFQQREFGAAAARLKQAVDIRPDAAEFLSNLALAMLCTGRIDECHEHFQRAVELGHNDINNLLQTGLELHQNGQLQAAEAAFQLALQVAPQSADAFHFLGLVQKAAGRFDEAVESYKHALQIQPNYPEVLNNLGNAYRDFNCPHEAICCYEAAIQLSSSFAAAHNNLGVAQLQVGNLQGAVAAFDQAQQLDPTSADPVNNLGNALRDVGRLEDARTCYERALELAPESAEIYNNLGAANCALQQVDAAIDCFQKSLRHKPTEVPVITNLAAALEDAGRYDEAAKFYGQASQLAPDNRLAKLRSNLVCPPVFVDSAAMERKWEEFTRLVPQYASCNLPGDVSSLLCDASPPPFAVQFFSHNVRPFKEAYADVFRQLASRWSEPLPAKSQRTRTRIGMVVTGRHEGIFLKSMRGIIERLDRERFELQVIGMPSGMERLKRELAACEVDFVRLPWRLDLAAETIRAAECDLLLYWEIGTDGANYFLPHLRLAPIQCTSWGIQVTSGIPNVDYYLSSRLVETPSAAAHYSEELILADTLLCYRYRPPLDGGMRSRESFGFSDQQIVFACPQQLGKFHPDFDMAIGEILRRSPNAVLAITSDSRGHGARTLQERFRNSLGDVAERVAFLPRLGFNDYLSLLSCADVLLDPPHFGGVNSTYDAFALGKPIVTLPSFYHRGRYTLGCYRKMGIFDCVAQSPVEYIDIACRLGTDQDLNGMIRERLIERSEVIFEDSSAVQEHERIFEMLVDRHAEK